MRISEIYKLNKTQAELDFIDIDVKKDLPLFLNPHFLANRSDSWSVSATRDIRSFFGQLLTLLKAKNFDGAKRLFAHLGEPNETCLGLSRGTPEGRGVGPSDAEKLFASIRQSKAVATGMVEHLEDCHIFVSGFGPDKLSDMTTNIIRKNLLQYTSNQCALHGIPLTSGVQSGHYWDRATTSWVNAYSDVLVVKGKRTLLVPKGLVGYRHGYTPQQYHQHFILNFLQKEHLELKTALVTKIPLRNGTTKSVVYKKDLKDQVSPGTKSDIETFTEKHPEVFKKFKKDKMGDARSLTDEEISEFVPSDNIEEVANYLSESLDKIPTGPKDASTYHILVTSILELLFYPDLIDPQKEQEIHEGRKRIDITFDNAAQTGIFFELHKLHDIACQYIFIECKNYTGDPTNPELDQLAGRFSPNRGKVGLLLCRRIQDMKTFLRRCSDTYKDDRGLILPLTDDDLKMGLRRRGEGIAAPLRDLLRDRRRDVQVKN